MNGLASRLREIVGSGPAKAGPHANPAGPHANPAGPHANPGGPHANPAGAHANPAGPHANPAGAHTNSADSHIDTRGGRLQPALTDAVADTLGGSWAESHGHRYLVVDRAYSPGYRHGRFALMDCLPPWPRLSLLRGPECRAASELREQLLFIDLETTGLTGGAGTYAFLVGCAWFDGPMFRIRQFFLSAYSGERALLDGLAQLADGISGVVSFNGKSFDLPLIETRYLFHRQQTPFAGMPHVDMVHPARRLWRGEDDEAVGRTASCRLAILEQTLCGVTRDDDVPGFEIPARYFNYVRSGDARPLERVFEHNRLDLISLALLTAEASRLLDEGPRAARTAREALGLGRLYERGGLWDYARESYAVAAGIGPAEAGPHDNRPAKAGLHDNGVGLHDNGLGAHDDGAGHYDSLVVVGAGFSRPDGRPDRRGDIRADFRADPLTLAEALRCYAVICRRQRRYADAADAWQRILNLRRCPPHIAREATEALAVHHEHRLRDLRSARQFALRSLGFDASASRQHATHYRLARLERKLGGPTTDALQF